MTASAKRYASRSCLAAGLALLASGCIPVKVNRGTTSFGDVFVARSPLNPIVNLLKLQVRCKSEKPKDGCNDIATIAAGEVSLARLTGVFDPKDTRIAIPGFGVDQVVFDLSQQGQNIATFRLTAPRDALPGLYTVYALSNARLAALSGALEVVE